MMRTKRRPVKKRVIRSWKEGSASARRMAEEAHQRTHLKRPRVIDVVPVDFLRDAPPELEGQPTQRFRGRLIFFTKDDVTVRRPSGALLVIDNYEIAGVSDGKTRFEAE